MAMNSRQNATSALASIDGYKLLLPDAASDLRVRFDELHRITEELDAEIASTRECHAKNLAEIVERLAIKTQREATALKADIVAKDSRIREINSKFAFVIGTVAEGAG